MTAQDRFDALPLTDAQKTRARKFWSPGLVSPENLGFDPTLPPFAQSVEPKWWQLYRHTHVHRQYWPIFVKMLGAVDDGTLVARVEWNLLCDYAQSLGIDDPLLTKLDYPEAEATPRPQKRRHASRLTNGSALNC